MSDPYIKVDRFHIMPTAVARDMANRIEQLKRDNAKLREDVLEEAIKACEEQRDIFLSEEYSAGQPMSSMRERFACKQCAEAIQALKETDSE